MAAQLRLLNSDMVTPFASHSFGNVLAGTLSVPKLVFADSYGDVDALSAEVGFEAIAGNDGYNFIENCSALTMNAALVTVNGSVETTGGAIAAGTVIEYRVTVKDRWGHESELNPASFSPTFSTGSTNKANITWDTVAGAFKYVLYSNIAAAGWFKVAETTVAAFTDLTGNNDGVTAPPGIASVAYKEGTYQSAPIAMGNLPPGTQNPVIYRVNVPGGTSSTGNPRQANAYVAMLTT